MCWSTIRSILGLITLLRLPCHETRIRSINPIRTALENRPWLAGISYDTVLDAVLEVLAYAWCVKEDGYAEFL